MATRTDPAASLRDRHVQMAYAAARRIKDNAESILRCLDAGTVPADAIVRDAVELRCQMAALQGINEASGLCEEPSR